MLITFTKNCYQEIKLLNNQLICINLTTKIIYIEKIKSLNYKKIKIIRLKKLKKIYF